MRTIRWQAVTTYRSDIADVTDTAYFEELEELQDHIERGPHWDTIVMIQITRVDPYYPELTLEQADAL